VASDLGKKVNTVYLDVLMSLPTNWVWLSSPVPSPTTTLSVFCPTLMTRSAKFSAFLFLRKIVTHFLFA
jgi:hypothetical protein